VSGFSGTEMRHL